MILPEGQRRMSAIAEARIKGLYKNLTALLPAGGYKEKKAGIGMPAFL
jgi:hypothetical protein